MAANTNLFGGVLNRYVRKPKNLTQYTAYRGVTDWTQIGQFDQFETGYSFLSVISIPDFLSKCAEYDADVRALVESFTHMLEYEFRNLDGIPDMTTEYSTITNGIQDVNMINKVTEDSSITVSMSYYEKAGGLITKFSEYYLTGIKDPRSEAKTYHGLIIQGIMDPGYEHEIFTLMYIVTDNTYLVQERAFLLANAQITQVDESGYNSSRGEISNKEITIQFNCFPIKGRQVDAAGYRLLKVITGAEYNTDWQDNHETNGGIIVSRNNKLENVNGNGSSGTAVLDANDYQYSILGSSAYNLKAETQKAEQEGMARFIKTEDDLVVSR